MTNPSLQFTSIEGEAMRVPTKGDGPTFSTFEDVRRGLFCRDLAQFTPAEMLKGNILEDVVFELHGSEHRERRRIENPLFRREAVVTYLGERFPEIIERTLDTILDSGERDAVRIGQLLTVVLAAEISGVDLSDDDLGAIDQMVRLERVFAEGTGIMDTTYDRAELLRMVRDAFEEFDRDFFAASVARRRASVDAGEPTGDDLLSVLIAHEEELKMDYALIMRETAFFLESGSDTSARTLANTLNYLFTWCAAHRKEWEEIRHGDDLMDFLERCIQEALRLSPILPVVRRVAVEDIVLNDVEISAGTVVYLNAIAANRDPSVFGADAAEFDPNRSLPAGVQGFGHGFSGGMHACIGRVLAMGAPATASGGERLFGQTTLMLKALVDRGVAADPGRPPIQDESSHWERIGSLPVLFDRVRPQQYTSTPKLQIEEDLCFGSGDCALLLPEVFAVGEDGVVEVDSTTLESVNLDALKRVTLRCPSGALGFSDE